MSQFFDTTPDTYTVVEAASILGVSDDCLYRLIRENECPVRVLKLGRRLRIPRKALHEYIDAS